MSLSIKRFVENGSFFDLHHSQSKIIDFIHNGSTYEFGEDESFAIYTFEQKSYDIEFVCDNKNQVLIAEQVKVHQNLWSLT